MPVSTPAPGQFSWFDYVTHDPRDAQAFFAELFGWTTQTMSLGTLGTYTNIVSEGRAIGGYRFPIPNTPSRLAVGTLSGTPEPAHWLPHLRVTSAHDAAAKTKQLGGKMLREPFAYGPLGRLAFALDPTNTVVALAEPLDQSDWNHAPNTFVWNELYTPSTQTAVAYYRMLAGFSEKKVGMPDGSTFSLLEKDEAARGGIRKPHVGMPSGWFAWVRVYDVDGVAGKAHRLGATIHQAPVDVGASRLCLLTDPRGCALGVISSP